MWSLEVVQRYGEYTCRQGEMKGIVGKKRIGKEMDRCLFTHIYFYHTPSSTKKSALHPLEHMSISEK
jgi:hypothetical protein